jgi:hypothetical protein
MTEQMCSSSGAASTVTITLLYLSLESNSKRDG